MYGTCTHYNIIAERVKSEWTVISKKQSSYKSFLSYKFNTCKNVQKGAYFNVNSPR